MKATTLQQSAQPRLQTILLLATLTFACTNGMSPTDPGPRIVGSGNFVTASRSVSGFNRVSIVGGAKLLIEQTGVESLVVTAEDNILPLLRSDVVGGRLVLGPPQGSNISTGEIVYELTVRDLNEVSTFGAITVEIKRIDTPHLDVTLSGPSRLEITQIDTPLLDVALSGPAFMRSVGTADEQDISLSGPASYRAGELQSRLVHINASGPSFAKVRVSDRLDVTLDLIATVQYLGSPVVSITGDGSVQRLGP